MDKHVKLFINGNTQSRNENDLNKDNIYINQKTMTEENNKNKFSIKKQSSNNLQIFAVCSGTGENHHGVTAASITMQSLKILQIKLQGKDVRGKEREVIKKFTEDLNEKILLYQRSAELRDIYVTLAMVIVLGDKAFTVHIGDCRVYYYNSKYSDFMQITKDHLQANNMVELGILKEEQALIHRRKSHLVKCIGKNAYDEQGVPDFSKVVELQKDDMMILTTDGITDCISNNELKRIIEDQDPNINNKINQIFKKVKNEEQKDDASIIIFQVEDVRDNVAKMAEDEKYEKKENKVEKVKKVKQEIEKAIEVEKTVKKVKKIEKIETDEDDEEKGEKLNKIMAIILGALLAIIISLLIGLSLKNKIIKEEASKDVISQTTDKINENGDNSIEQENEVKDTQEQKYELKTQEQNNQDIMDINDINDIDSVKPKSKEEIQAEDLKESEETNNETSETYNEIPETYIVQQGDTLYSICMKFYKSKEPLMKLKTENDMLDDKPLKIGQVIKLPTLIHDPINNRDMMHVEYKVQKGDTLYSISKKIYKTSKKVQEIMDMNNIQEPESIVEGMLLKLP